ncbi:hypothetical protein BDV40DRAFT_304515 [Aspergillus tamarii]|uniref:Inhibitor I9 domain-containing protein n=1 Tax=Aspergillus tamarii TaxID=41984 RepID=A0A5N6UJ21_ASPTM|nr:hypothetical protein BDV40DRAFT_304515 [Aspergillus tamarii]
MLETARFIVIFRDSVAQETVHDFAEHVNSSGGEVTNLYDPDNMQGFAAELTSELVNEFTSLGTGLVEYIERDSVVATA